MRDIYLLLLLIITLTASLKSQALQDFDANEGITQATTEAGASLSSPYLKGVGMVNLDKFDLELTIDASYNPNTGLSKIWIYFFGNADDPNDEEMEFIPIGKLPFIGLTNLKNFGFPTDLQFEDIFPPIPLKENWIGSVAYVQLLSSNSDYLSLVEKYSDSEYEILGVGSNDDEETGIYADPYWLIEYSNQDNESSFVCYTHALNNTTECFDLAETGSVKFELATDIKLFPQPATEEIYANLNNDYKTYKVVDLFGNEINSGSLNQGDKLFNLNISNFASGVYYLILENENINDVVRFVKI